MKIIALFLSVCLASCATTWRAPSSESSTAVLLLSDIHFDPFSDPRLVQKLKDAKDGYEWSAIFKSSTQTELSQPGEDTNYPLFRSSLDAMKTMIPEPSTILISGDFLRHNFQLAAATAPGQILQKPKQAPRTTKIDPLAQDLAIKTIQFLADSLQKTFPNAQIIPALGNNDSACDDYQLAPNEPFLAAMAKAFAPSSGVTDFANQFSGAGHVNAQLAGVKNIRVLSLNDVYWSKNYFNGCGDAKANPGEDELAWLTASLNQSSEAGQKVWLLNHIPAGVDASSVVFGKQPVCSSKNFPMMLGNWNSSFLDLIGKSSGILSANIVGHTHTNEFRLYGQGGGALIPVMLVPSISPVHGNNPAFQVIQVNTSNAEIQNLLTYSLDLSGNGTNSNSWRQIGDFNQDYQQTGVSSSSLQQIVNSLQTKPTELQKYISRMNSGAAAPIAAMEKDPKAFLCEITNLDASSYQACYCNAP